MQDLFRVLCMGLFIGIASSAQAGAILIVSGTAGTDEPGTTANIVTNLTTLHTAAGNSVAESSDIPSDLSPYSQVWDVRFSNVFALTAPQQTQYLGFLQGGGGMFLMGENDSFMPRNTSVFDFISLAGGGTIGPDLVGGCDGLQNVIPPFTGPNPVTTVNFNCSGVVASKGTGEWIAERDDHSGGSGIAWGVGDLANANAGALTVILDVNFMENTGTVEEQNLTKNLIHFVDQQVEPPDDPAAVPEPATLTLMGLGAALSGLSRRRRRPR